MAAAVKPVLLPRRLLTPFLTTCALAAGLASPAGAGTGGDIPINEVTENGQSVPSLAVDSDGSFVVVWQDIVGFEPSTAMVIGRRFQADGTPIGGDFEISELGPGTPLPNPVFAFPKVAMDGNGGFVVVWVSLVTNGGDADGSSIQARRFDSDGVALGPQFQVNTFTAGVQQHADVATSPDGGFVVVWDSFGSPETDNSLESILGRRFDSDGVGLGDDFQLNTTVLGQQLWPRISIAGDGVSSVVWQSSTSSGGDNPTSSIQLRSFDSMGVARAPDMQVNTVADDFQKSPDVSANATGDVVVVWHTEGLNVSDLLGLSARRFLPDGAAVGDEFEVDDFLEADAQEVRVSVDPTGGFAASWASLGSPGDDDDSFSVQARFFSSADQPLGPGFQVNDFIADAQGFGEVSVGYAGGGEYAIVWDSFLQDGDDFGIFGAVRVPEPGAALCAGAALAALGLLRRRRARFGSSPASSLRRGGS